MKIFQDKTVDLDLNGPILSFTTEPTGVGSTGVGINSTGGGSVELTGIATATFPTSATNAGYVTYRWYEQGVGALSDSTYVTGTATTTLTLTNLITPNDNQRKFYLQADYIPSYYVTGNATNDPFNSGIGTVTVDPLIDQTYRGLEHYVGKFIRDTKGMDGEHPGPISHAQLALIIIT